MGAERRRELKRDLLACGLIFGLVLAFLWPVTLGGKLLLPADMLMVMQPWKAHARDLGFQRVQQPFLDAIQQHYPWRKFAAEQMRGGEIPLWNPYMACGAPFVANNQSACFYPETWLFCLMPPERAFGWAALLSLTLGGCFLFFFLRLLGLRRLACVCGVMCFVFSGFIVGWLLLPTVRAVPVWLPLMLLTFELAVRRRSTAWAAVGALAVGLQFLAGHLHVSLFILLIFGAYVLYRLGQEWRAGDRARVGWGVGAALGMLGVGTGLAALQLLPVLELVSMNTRQAGVTLATARANAMVPLYLLAGLMPDVFGNPVDYNFWGWTLFASRREYIETAWYIGLAFPLLFVPALLWARQRQSWLWAGVWLGGVGLAWGTVLYQALFILVPPLRQLPGISRAVLLCCFAGAVLTALGIDAISRLATEGQGAVVRRWLSRSTYALVAVILGGGLLIWMQTGALENQLPGIGTYTLEQVGRALVLLLATAGMLAALASGKRWARIGLPLVMAIDLLLFAGHFTPEVPARYLNVQTEVIDRLQADHSIYRMTSLIGQGKGIDRFPPNLPMAFGLQDVQASDSLVYSGYQALRDLIPSDEAGNPDPASPLLDVLNCKYLVTSLDLSDIPKWRRVTSYETNVYENAHALPRAFIPAHVEWVAGKDTLARMRDHWRPAETTFVHGQATHPPVSGGEVTVSDYRPSRVTLTGQVPAGQVAVLGDIWYPGWRACADGRPTEVLRADYMLRAVTPDREARRIQFVYYPASFAVGQFLACLACLVIAGALVVGRRRS
jgi:hypothetical protein